MSRNSTELINIKCDGINSGIHHNPCTQEKPVVVGFGSLRVFPRQFKSRLFAHPRSFGPELKCTICTECWNHIDVPAQLLKLIDSNSTGNLFDLGHDFSTEQDQSLGPITDFSVECKSNLMPQFHKDEAIGVTHDICVRGLLIFQPQRYIRYTDTKAFMCEIEVDCCLHCFASVWYHIREYRLDKLIAGFIGTDLCDNPDLPATSIMHRAITGV